MLPKPGFALMRLAPVLAVLALALAGCSGGKGGAAEGGTGTEGSDLPAEFMPYTGNATDNATALVPRSGTLHLLDRPDVTIAAPPAGEAKRVRVWSTVDTAQGNFVGAPQAPPSWEFTWPDESDSVVANGTFWVEIQGQPPPNPTSCFWDLVLSFQTSPSSSVGFSVCAGFEDFPTTTGPHRLDFEFRFSGFDVPAGAQVSMQLYGGMGPNPPGTEAALLTGSAEFDSQVTFQGEQFTDDPGT